MEILEKLKGYSNIVFQYISTRFGVLKFTVFAMLLCLLSVTEMQEWQKLVENFIFIFASLFAFRLLDDAWSFYLDRIHHPDRLYLLQKNFGSFIFFAGFVIIVYQAGLFLYSGFLAITMLILFLFSTLLYFLFFRKKSIMAIIPLLKYPVLIWCLSRFSTSAEVLYLSAGAFFMMLTSDYIDENKSTGTLNYKILLILITGILIFQPWNGNSSILTAFIFISIPIILIAFLSMDKKPFFPIVVFPVLHFLELIISK